MIEIEFHAELQQQESRHKGEIYKYYFI